MIFDGIMFAKIIILLEGFNADPALFDIEIGR